MHSLIDYVLFVPNILSNVECDLVIDWYNQNIENEAQSLVGDGSSGKVSKERTSSSMDVPLNSDVDIILSKSIDATLLAYFENLNERCELKDDVSWLQLLPKKLKSEKFIINRYDDSEWYFWHSDQGYNYLDDRGIFMRQFSVVIYLNDNFEGGETEFQFAKFKPQKGSCLIFPSNWIFNHCARPVKNGVKYSVASWLAPLIEEDV